MENLDTWLTVLSLVIVFGFVVREPGRWLTACFGWMWEWALPPSSVSVNTPEADEADEADRRADRPSVSAESVEPPRLQVDRTRAAIIDTLVEFGWSVQEIRAIVKGDNGAISAEVAAARQRLGLADAPRVVTMRDHTGERTVAL